MRAGKALPLNLAGVRQVVISFGDDHLPSNVTVELANGSSIEADQIYQYQPKPFPGSPAYQAFEAVFGRAKELRAQVSLAVGGVR